MCSYPFQVCRGTSTGKIVQTVTERPALINDQVLISITNSRVCETDERFICSGTALGYEGVGIDREIGREMPEIRVTVQPPYKNTIAT